MLTKKTRKVLVAGFLVAATGNELVHNHHGPSHGRRQEDVDGRRRTHIETMTNRSPRSTPPLNDGNPPARTTVEEITARRRASDANGPINA